MPVVLGPSLLRIHRLRWCALLLGVTVLAAILLCGLQKAGLLVTSKYASHGFSADRSSVAAPGSAVIIRRTKLHHRRLLDLDRIGDGCALSDINILQGEANPLPDGIPTFTVQIFNSCSTEGGCGLSDIHVECGWWATAKLVNPRVFRRLGFNDCLVNDGRPLKPGQLLTFQYANSFQYAMSVKSVSISCR